VTDDERARKLQDFHAGRVIAELEKTAAEADSCPIPNHLQMHPYYEPHRHTILAWLDDGLFGGDALNLPRRSAVLPVDLETGPSVLDFDTIRRGQPFACLGLGRSRKGAPLPAPRTDGYGFYWWWTARDQAGRTVAGRNHFKEY
jgi:hypothetical protein